MPKTSGNTVPPLPIQPLPAKITALMAAISPAGVETEDMTLVSFMGIDPDNFGSNHRREVGMLIELQNLGGVLEIIDRDGYVLLVDRATQGERVSCNLSLDDEALAYFSNELVPGEFVYKLMVLLAEIKDPATANDPDDSEMFIDFSRKNYVLWAHSEDDDHLPFTWADVKTLLTL